MSAILEEQYFRWLYAHVSDPNQIQPHHTYWEMLKQLHQKEFVYVVANDDNRCMDGRQLRDDFRLYWDEEREPLADFWLAMPCSMLEMLIALTDRLEFQTDQPPEYWFWILLSNLKIADFNDARYDTVARGFIDEALEQVIWRTYSYDGRGGLFPLRHAQQDQRKLEIWFQMHSYLLEGL